MRSPLQLGGGSKYRVSTNGFNYSLGGLEEVKVNELYTDNYNLTGPKTPGKHLSGKSLLPDH